MALDLSLLNPQQKKAVLQTEGPLLVLAGAGSGKTRVIAHRVVHLLEQGVPARAILAVTFTNKAAAEMKERIVKLAAGAAEARRVTVSTFHAFGAKLVREQHDKLLLPAKFAILDSGDQAALVKRLLREVKIDDKRFDVGRVLAVLSRLRTSATGSAGDGRRPQAAVAMGGAGSAGDGRRPQAAVAMGGAGSAGDGRRPQAAVLKDEYALCAEELLPRYELGLRAMGAVDFDDLLLLPLRLFSEQPEVLEKYQGRYRYLLVDEYQDTNPAQLQLLERLSGLRRNLCVVGDDDQSIYAWRGAQVRHVLEFDRKFPGCVEVFLEQNYRSSGNILEAANAVIGRNPGRKPKKLWTERGRGPNLRLVVAPSDEAEARHVADEIVRICYEEKIPPREIAVLYRTNAQARPLEEALRLSGVRYRVVGGTSLFDRKEVRDLVAYLRSALNPRDEVALLRIVNVPARGIGDQTVARAQELARARKCTVWDVFSAAPSELSHAGERIAAFVALLRKYGELLSRRGFSEAARALVAEVGLFEEARRGAQSAPAQARRIEAIESLLRQLIEYEKRQEQKAAERSLQSRVHLQEGAPQPHPSGILSAGSDIDVAARPGSGDIDVAARPGSGATDVAARPGSGDVDVAARPGSGNTASAAAAEPDDDDEPFAAGLSGYLQRLALDSKDADGDSFDAVTLMTLHGAKGLEWRCVFLCGLEEGLLPHSGRGFDDGGEEPHADGAINLEEERRLCYVGLTRARERLILTRAAERTRRGKAIPRTPSRFLEDIPAALLDVIDLSGPQKAAPKEVQEAKAKSFFATMNALLGEPDPPAQ